MQTYVYTCPNCGNDLRLTVLTCDPPINKYECYKCGWSYEDKRDETIRIPFSEKQYYKTNFNSSACLYCSNNLDNGGSRICHCVLGIPSITC